LLEPLATSSAPKQALSQRIAQVCTLSLKEVGLNAGGNVCELKNSQQGTGCLLSLQPPQRLHIAAVDVAAQTGRSCAGHEAQSLYRVLSLHSERRGLACSGCKTLTCGLVDPD